MKLPSIAELIPFTRSSISSNGSPLPSFQEAPSMASSIVSGIRRASISGSSSSSLSPLVYSSSLNESMPPCVDNKYRFAQRGHDSYGLPSLMGAAHDAELSQPVFMQPGMPTSIEGRFYLPAHELDKVHNVPIIVNRRMNQCHRCGTKESPEWRRGPNGLRTLCNACGIFYAKLVKHKEAGLAAEQIPNKKVCKSKNSRSKRVKRWAKNDSRNLRETQAADIPSIPHAPPQIPYMPPSHQPHRLFQEGIHHIPIYQQEHHPQVFHHYLHPPPQQNLSQLTPFEAESAVFPQHTGAGMMSPPELAHPEHFISVIRF